VHRVSEPGTQVLPGPAGGRWGRSGGLPRGSWAKSARAWGTHPPPGGVRRRGDEASGPPACPTGPSRLECRHLEGACRDPRDEAV